MTKSKTGSAVQWSVLIIKVHLQLDNVIAKLFHENSHQENYEIL